jgi:hypothetical protein
VLHLGVVPEDVTALWERTEGWAGGLYLTARAGAAAPPGGQAGSPIDEARRLTYTAVPGDRPDGVRRTGGRIGLRMGGRDSWCGGCRDRLVPGVVRPFRRS